MQKFEKLALNSIGKEPRFRDSIEKLTAGVNLGHEDQAYILAVAMLLIRRYHRDKRYTSFADLAYYIVLKYSLQYKDYAPLYDFSVNFGFYPIAKELLNDGFNGGNIISGCLGEIQLERFQNKDHDTLTLEQFNASSAFLDEKASETCYLAPTSFGKSALIVDQIRRLGEHPCRIVIVVPTKSLLIQTFHMVRKANLRRKLMIHDEMYAGEKSFIAVFTQERTLRLLNKHEIAFDLLFVDEAHNLLKGDPRSILLSRAIARNRARNPDNRVLYLSPLVQDPSNLRLVSGQNISSHIVTFNVKEPEIFELRLNKETYQYNRFLNEFYLLQKNVEQREYLLSKSGDKNFVYNNRPVKIERLADEICGMLPQIEATPEILELARTLAAEVHPDFYAISHLKHGVVYLHGKLPDLVKEYLESKYKDLPQLKYVIANSVILEGMNLPIDTLFIFNTRGLYGKELMNLIGRVNRLNTIFGQGRDKLERLLPQVHFINTEDHNRVDSRMEAKIGLLRSRVFEDKILNPTLEAFDVKALREQKQIDKAVEVQNHERFLAAPPATKKDEIRAYLIQSGIIGYYSDPNELIERFIAESAAIKSSSLQFWANANMMEKIEYVFLRDIQGNINLEIGRLRNKEARNFYEGHMLVAQKKSLKENVARQVEYFKERAASGDSLLYFGESYGEEVYETDQYPGVRAKKVYVDVARKDDKQLVNLAVVRLKIEDDFVSFVINKFIVMLYDYQLISPEEYNRYIYGTTDEKKIRLTKYGLSVGMVSRLEEDGQLGNLDFDEFNNLRASPEFEEFLATISDFYRFEIRRFVG